ncbi:unnamed protein product, partial [Gongylonema pulchrum]|uniref:V-type ATP synthase subunit D n=1 Tax=Gongylonema pulchrum TaxID=637853 RepID=A0A183F0K0_9BILA
MNTIRKNRRVLRALKNEISALLTSRTKQNLMFEKKAREKTKEFINGEQIEQSADRVIEKWQLRGTGSLQHNINVIQANLQRT